MTVGSESLAASPDTVPELALTYRRFIWRRVLWLAVFAAILVFSMLLNVTIGSSGLGIADVLRGIFTPDSLDLGSRVIIQEVRLPVALMAVVVGACLGLAGAEMQTVLNNPLASPSTFGVMHAAALGASLAIVFGFGGGTVGASYVIPFAAFIGASASILCILALSRAYGGTLDVVILFGITTVFALDALISLIQFIADSDSLQQIVFWTMGSLARATWDKIFIVTSILALCLPFTLAQVWRMTALRAGEEHARSYGVSVDRLRYGVLLRVSLLTAAAISFTGVIGFVGLIGPHIARIAFGEDHRFYLPGAAIAGAFILSGASILSKTISPGILIPDGIVTALVGIPLFLGILLTRRKRGW
jgi:iron complex transport system permease protein